jgi:penicillin-binding protein 2
MVGVTREGTSAKVFANTGYVSAGKTGTSQVIAIKKNEKYDASKIDERHRDHSLYTAFAPADKPRIAIAIIVENGGFGAVAAAPIVREALDYYLLGKRSERRQDDLPVEKIDLSETRPLAEVRADQDSDGGPREGAETRGNRD